MAEHNLNPEHIVSQTVLDILDLEPEQERPEQKYYVEVGAGHYKDGNNSFLLETEHGWKGVSLDIDEASVAEFNELRSNPCILHDAQTFNYTKYFEENNYPKQIDFLQLDIENDFDFMGQNQDEGLCLRALIALPLNTYRFAVITFEHNVVQNFKNEWVRDVSRRLLDSFGYALVVRMPHEDIWVDPNVVPFSKYKNFFQLNSSWRD